jgi:hypothetical protein
MTTTAPPPMPTQPPAPVMLVPVPEQAPKPAPEWLHPMPRLKAGAAAARTRAAAWLTVAELEDEKAALAEVRVDRDRRNEHAIRRHQRDTRDMRRQMSAAGKGGDELAAARLGAALDALTVAGPDTVGDAITRRDITRLRWTRRLTRISIAVAGAYVAVVLPMHAPIMVLAELAAAIGTAWIAGRQAESEAPQETVIPQPRQERPLKVDPTKNPLAPVEPELIEQIASELNDVNVKPGPGAKQDAQTQASAHLTRVLQEAGVLRAGQKAKVIALPLQLDGAQIVTIELAGGVTAKKAIGATEQIASALGVDAVQVDIRQAPGHAGAITLWIADGDPFEATRLSPLLDVLEAVNLWSDGAPLAFIRRGEEIRFRVADSGLLVAGATRSGKGVLIAGLLLAAALDPRINIRLVDGKGSGESNVLAPVLATFFKVSSHRLDTFLTVLLDEMNRRAEWLDERNLPKLEEEHIEAIGGLELVVIDEFAVYTGKGSCPERESILELMSQLAAVAASMGIILVPATQVPETEVIPSRLRQNLTSRAAFRTESAQQSNTILGDGMAGRGFDASAVPLGHRGRGWLLTPDTGCIEVRSYFIPTEDKAVIVERAIELRRAAGRLPGMWADPIETAMAKLTGLSMAAGGPTGRGRITRELTPARRTLRDSIAVMELAAVDRMRTDPLLAALQELDSAHYSDINALALNSLLREAGAGTTVALGALDGMANPKGYKLAALKEAAAKPL